MMPEKNYIEELLKSSESLILHRADWCTRIGEELCTKLIEGKALAKPDPLELEGQVVEYFTNNIFVESEVIIEGETILIEPLKKGFPIVEKTFKSLELYKFSLETVTNYIREINNISQSRCELGSKDVHIIGELCFFKLKMLFVFTNLEEKQFDKLSRELVSKDFKMIINLNSRIDRVIVSENIVHTPYSDFIKIPIEVFHPVSTKMNCKDLSTFFEYPLVIDRQKMYIYIYGERLGVKKNTNLYKFVSALADSRDSLPMETDLFFRMHEITVEASETAIKELRSQLKEKILKTKLDQDKKDFAFKFFDLVSGEKSRGMVNLKLEKHNIQIWS